MQAICFQNVDHRNAIAIMLNVAVKSFYCIHEGCLLSHFMQSAVAMLNKMGVGGLSEGRQLMPPLPASWANLSQQVAARQQADRLLNATNRKLTNGHIAKGQVVNGKAAGSQAANGQALSVSKGLDRHREAAPQTDSRQVGSAHASSDQAASKNAVQTGAAQSVNAKGGAPKVPDAKPTAEVTKDRPKADAHKPAGSQTDMLLRSNDKAILKVSDGKPRADAQEPANNKTDKLRRSDDKADAKTSDGKPQADGPGSVKGRVQTSQTSDDKAKAKISSSKPRADAESQARPAWGSAQAAPGAAQVAAARAYKVRSHKPECKRCCRSYTCSFVQGRLRRFSWVRTIAMNCLQTVQTLDSLIDLR